MAIFPDLALQARADAGVGPAGIGDKPILGLFPKQKSRGTIAADVAGKRPHGEMIRSFAEARLPHSSLTGTIPRQAR